MRARKENDTLSVHVIAGTHCVLLGFDVKGVGTTEPLDDLSTMLSKLVLDSRRCNVGGSDFANNSTRVTRSSLSRRSDVNIPYTAVFVGFSVDRRDKVAGQQVSLNYDDKPIQKFHFGDYTALPGTTYEYTVRLMFHSDTACDSDPKFVALGSPVIVSVSTEDPQTGLHGIYFNRGVAGSKAYASRFGEFRECHHVTKFGRSEWKATINPRTIRDPVQSMEALAWLSRGLEEAILQFISQASGAEYRLHAAVYEFTHAETVQAFASAVERGVNVKIIRHYKGTYQKRMDGNDIVRDESGKIVKDWVPDTATEEATNAINAVCLNSSTAAQVWHHDTFIERRQSSGIMHNKFIILVKNGTPMQVWTGSTNFTDSGIYGQSNVGHIIRDEGVATKFADYWDRLSRDPHGRKRPSKASGMNGNDAPMDEVNERMQPDMQGQITSSPSITVIFSPRKSIDMLQWYADRLGEAKLSVHYTAPFGIAQPLAEVLNRGHSFRNEGLRRSLRILRQGDDEKNKPGVSLLRFLLLDSRPSKKSSNTAKQNAEKKGNGHLDYYDLRDIKENRCAFGAVLHPSDECLTGLSTFVDYIHTKYMILDALTDNPSVFTGSANFSAASTEKNDENMMLIQGDTGVADVYVTEFTRLFDHFYSRDQHNDNAGNIDSREEGHGWGEVVMDGTWLQPYFDPSSQLYRERMLLR